MASRGLKAVSEPAAALVLFLAAVAILALVAALAAPQLASLLEAAEGEGERAAERLSARLNPVYLHRGRLLIANDGEAPVRIVKLILDGREVETDFIIPPGGKREVRVGGARDIAAVTDSGLVVELVRGGMLGPG